MNTNSNTAETLPPEPTPEVAPKKGKVVKTKPEKVEKKAKPVDISQKITLLSKDNPHKADSKDHGKFAKLRKLATKTVNTALAAGIDKGYLNYAVKRGLIKVG